MHICTSYPCTLIPLYAVRLLSRCLSPQECDMSDAFLSSLLSHGLSSFAWLRQTLTRTL